MTKTIPFMPERPMYAYAYLPYQRFENLYDIKCALKQGTVFKDLDVPFEKYKNNPLMSPFK